MGVIYLRKKCLQKLKDYITFKPGKFDTSNINLATNIKLNNVILYEFNKEITFTKFQIAYWLWIINDNYTGLYPILELRNGNTDIIFNIQYYTWQATYFINGNNMGRHPELYGRNPGEWIYCINYYTGGVLYNYMNAELKSQTSISLSPVKYISIGGAGSLEENSRGWGSGYSLCKTDDIIFYYDNDCIDISNIPSKYHDSNYVDYNIFHDYKKEMYGIK